MKNSITRYTLILSLLTAGLLFFGVPEASAKLSRQEVIRCLTGRFRVRGTSTANVFDIFGAYLFSAPLNGSGSLKIGGASGRFKALDFRYSRTRVRGQNKVILKGSVNPTNLNFGNGRHKTVITKRGGRATVKGSFKWTGFDVFGNLWVVNNGASFGGKRLPKNCR